MPQKEKGDSSEKYKIFETDEFLKRLKRFSPNDRNFIELKLTKLVYHRLREEPHYGNNIKKLRNYVPEMWRFRIGKYRLFYTIDEKDKIVLIITVELRKNAY